MTERYFKGSVTAQNLSGDKAQVPGTASQGKLYIFISQVTVREKPQCLVSAEAAC